MKPTHARCPLSCEYLTAGKSYKIYNYTAVQDTVYGSIIDDNGEKIFVSFSMSTHTNNLSWELLYEPNF